MTNKNSPSIERVHYQPGFSQGLTLVELLIVIAIAAIIAQLSLPEFSDVMKNNRSTANINELQTSLGFARTEAVMHNSTVVLCKSRNGTACQDSGDDWTDGWIVFADSNRDGAVSKGEKIFNVQGQLEESFTLTFTPTRVSYVGTGLVTAGQNGTYKLCDDRGARYAKGVIISATGRPRLAIDSDNSGVVEDASGKDLVCS